jgi:sugar lactone lactonase YvrE
LAAVLGEALSGTTPSAVCTGSTSSVQKCTGELLGIVEVPTPLVTSCAFGGQTLEDLYITTASRDLDPIPVGAGDLYLARIGAAGAPSHRFRG